MEYLKSMLGNDFNQFLGKHFSRLPYSCTGAAKNFTHLLNWKVIDGIFKAKKSVLRIVQDGKMIQDYVEIDFDQAKIHHGRGETLLIRYAEKSDSDLKKLADDFSHSFHTPVDIQLYCTPEGHNAFGWHYDVEEVFIIQASGSKHYTLRPNTIHPLPLVQSIQKNQGYHDEKSELKIEVTLKEGDFLYIPSGWWHMARTRQESMHISIGLMPSSALDILTFLPEHLAPMPFWRTRMPIHQVFASAEEENLFYSDAMLKIAEELKNAVSKPEFIEAFLSFKKK